tara:strand:- start:1405 stop:2385 length:981 start_codon:yes stop_codon:yes gene_type:complete
MKNYMKTKFAIGCLVQWYEVDIIVEYLDSLKDAIDAYDGEVLVDFYISQNQDLEKCISNEQLDKCVNKILTAFDDMHHYINSVNGINEKHLVTVSDYRREFNSNYCEQADVLIWGESDAILPKQMFIVLDSLHQQVNLDNPKYLGFFGTCKMWDDTWKVLEHPEFTDKPFIGGDEKNWWSLRYDMTKDEMNTINDKTDELDVRIVSPHKFNGCGLVISSEVIKAGVNIPRSVFFVHEDTAFMHMTNKVLGNIPQYVIKNILLVHNRKHKNKRKYIKGEDHLADKDPGGKRLTHDWYMKANKMCEQNYINLFNPNYKSYTWEDVWKQ